MVQYLEEPVQDIRDLPAYFRQTGIPIGLDETLDEVFAPHSTLPLHHQLGHTAEDRLGLLVSELGEGAVGALVVKPGAVGGFERALDLHRWAGKRGIHVSAALAHSIEGKTRLIQKQQSVKGGGKRFRSLEVPPLLLEDAVHSFVY